MTLFPLPPFRPITAGIIFVSLQSFRQCGQHLKRKKAVPGDLLSSHKHGSRRSKWTVSLTPSVRWHHAGRPCVQRERGSQGILAKRDRITLC